MRLLLLLPLKSPKIPPHLRKNAHCGGRSSVGRALGCGPGCRGFEPHRPPHLVLVPN